MANDKEGLRFRSFEWLRSRLEHITIMIADEDLGASAPDLVSSLREEQALLREELKRRETP